MLYLLWIIPICYMCSFSYWSGYMGNKCVKIFLCLSLDCWINLGQLFMKSSLLDELLFFVTFFFVGWKYRNCLLTIFEFQLVPQLCDAHLMLFSTGHVYCVWDWQSLILEIWPWFLKVTQEEYWQSRESATCLTEICRNHVPLGVCKKWFAETWIKIWEVLSGITFPEWKVFVTEESSSSVQPITKAVESLLWGER